MKYMDFRINEPHGYTTSSCASRRATDSQSAIELASGRGDVDWRQVIKAVHAATTFRRALGSIDLFGGEPANGTACQLVISGTSTKRALAISTASDVRREA